MLSLPSDFSGLRILVTNDDGIHAEGLRVLAGIARKLSSDVWVVAPETEQSGAGHSLTLHMPLRVRKLGARRFAVSGTPTDCVLLAAKEIIPRRKRIGLVLSGINRGMNVAEDVTYSGTIAAAMEGTLLGLPSIAVSLSLRDGKVVAWKTAEAVLPRILDALGGLQWPKKNLISVNIPAVSPHDVRGVRLAPQGQRKIAEDLDARIDPKGRPYYWLSGDGNADWVDAPGTDYTLLKEGYATVTPICLDMTNREMMASMTGRIAKIRV